MESHRLRCFGVSSPKFLARWDAEGIVNNAPAVDTDCHSSSTCLETFPALWTSNPGLPDSPPRPLLAALKPPEDPSLAGWST